MHYVFKAPGREIEFTAATDMAAWCYVIENHSVSRIRAMPGETLYRIESARVERPSKERLKQHTKLMAAANNAARR